MTNKMKNWNLGGLRIEQAWILGAIMIMWGGAVQSPAREADLETKLRGRIGAFWDAMIRTDYEAAARFIHSEQRAQFIHEVPKSRVLKWRIDKLSFNEDRTACDAVTLVTKPLPVVGGTADWPLRNRWVFVEGDWYFTIPWEKGKNPFLDAFKDQQGIGIARNTAEPDPFKTGAPTRSAPASSSVEVVPDTGNPTTVHLGEKTTLRYTYLNKGTQPLHVVSVHADCHCTAVKKDYPVVEPGRQGSLEVVLDTFGLPIGRLNKDVFVQFKEVEAPITLTISVENAPNFLVVPPAVEFGAVEKGKPAERAVRVMNKSGKLVRILSHFNSDPRLEVSLEKTSFQPEEGVLITLRYRAATSGEFLDNVLLRTDLQAEPLISIRIQGKVGF